jgi:hypothetical protein
VVVVVEVVGSNKKQLKCILKKREKKPEGAYGGKGDSGRGNGGGRGNDGGRGRNGGRRC